MSPRFIEGRIEVLLDSKIDRALRRTFNESDYTEITIGGVSSRTFISGRDISPPKVVYTFISLESE